MRHLLDSRKGKYVQRYGFLSFARKFGDKYGKKINELVDIETKQE